MPGDEEFSLVEYIGCHRDYHCGYCNSDRFVSHGMWAHDMTCRDYQDLIDRGWRRSGQYCYKPSMMETCCPSYTIKCDANNFKLSKSHKKILKRMNKYLSDGIGDNKNDTNGEQHDDEIGNCNGGGDVGLPAEVEAMSSRKPDHNLDMKNMANCIKNSMAEKKRTKSTSKKCESKQAVALPAQVVETVHLVAPSVSAGSSLGSQSTNSINVPRKKAKLLRIERKREKLAQKGIQMETVKANPKNVERTLKDFFADEPTTRAHTLKVINVPAAEGETEECFKLFEKYQIHVHHDTPDKLSLKRYTRFLVTTPLQIDLVPVKSAQFLESLRHTFLLYKKYQTIVHNDPPEDVEAYLDFLQKSPLKPVEPNDESQIGYGSFHQQYWLDDKLIAVAVIDILPMCVSSVYFFYDPDYGFLSLGTYGSLREIYYTQQLSERDSNLSNYYMGFYIHSCPKMRYKGKLNPSYLLCPETYTWHLIDKTQLEKLDENKYQRLCDDAVQKDDNDFSHNDLDSILILYRKTCMPYEYYREINGSRMDSKMMEYGRFVGIKCAKRMIVYMK